MATLARPEQEILDMLAASPADNVLVRDGADRRWFVYEFGETPPTITDVRQDVAEALVEEGFVDYLDKDTERRKPLPDDFDVYSLSESGQKQLRGAGS